MLHLACREEFCLKMLAVVCIPSFLTLADMSLKVSFFLSGS